MLGATSDRKKSAGQVLPYLRHCKIRPAASSAVATASCPRPCPHRLTVTAEPSRPRPSSANGGRGLADVRESVRNSNAGQKAYRHHHCRRGWAEAAVSVSVRPCRRALVLVVGDAERIRRRPARRRPNPNPDRGHERRRRPRPKTKPKPSAQLKMTAEDEGRRRRRGRTTPRSEARERGAVAHPRRQRRGHDGHGEARGGWVVGIGIDRRRK